MTRIFAVMMATAVLLGGCSFTNDALLPSLGIGGSSSNAAPAKPGGPGVQTADIAPGSATGTFVGQKVIELRAELSRLQTAIGVEQESLQTLQTAASAPPSMPYQRGQFWVRRFRAQAEALCATLAALTNPTPAPDFVRRALALLESTGWIAAHRFLFAGVRCHLLGWPRGLAPDGRRAAVCSAAAPA